MISNQLSATSRSDRLLVLLSLIHGVFLLWMPSIPLIALGLWWNSNTVSHYFIHVPFFRSKTTNTLYSLYLSALLGIPQSLWRDRHLAHHGGYVMRLRVTPILITETAAVLSLWTLLINVAPQFFAFVYVPGYVLGLGLCYLHGYFEHATGAASHYGKVYNMAFFNDGYHVEHHARPSEHWTRLPQVSCKSVRASRWPAVLRWIEIVNLESLERLALRFRKIQRLLLKTHRRALRQLLPNLSGVRTVKIVGGGMYPRTALLLQELLPQAALTVVDSKRDHLDTAKTFLEGDIQFECCHYSPGHKEAADLVVIPLSFDGDRRALYRNPPGPAVLVHDWIWSRHGTSAIVSPILLKRINLIIR